MKQKSSLSSPAQQNPICLGKNEDLESTLPLLLSTLSAKERDALERACSGADYPEIAATLGINRWSFKSRVERAKAKIGVNTRLQAITLLKASEIRERILIPQIAERFGLFPREMDVLTLICRGMNRPAIAQELVVGENTVREHINTFAKNLGHVTALR